MTILAPVGIIPLRTVKTKLNAAITSMTKYRLDESRFLRGKLSRNMQVWLEEIKIQPDGQIFYTENYRQVSLIKLMKKLKH